MRRLSSFWTPFSTWNIPAFLICAFATGAISSAASHGFSTELLLGFCGVVAFIVFLQKVLASDLADEVIDFGDSLFVRRGRLKDRIPLANVLKVETSVAVNPPRMTIYSSSLALLATLSLSVRYPAPLILSRSIR